MKVAPLNVIVPSRSRPDSIARLAHAVSQTCNPRFTDLTVVVDHDDPKLPDYYDAAGRDQWWDLVVQDQDVKLGPVLNRAAVKAAEDYPYVAFMGDDHLPRSPLWDEQLVQSLIGKPGVAYGNDLFQGPNLPTAVVMSSDVVRVLGYMSPPALVHLYLDDFWKMLGESVGNLVYRGDVVIEHLHPVAGKAQWTPEYQWTTSQELMSADGERYRQYLSAEWPRELARLKKELGLD